MRRKDFELDSWPSVADFMLSLFILAIATGALMIIVQRLQTLSSQLKGTILTDTISINRRIEEIILIDRRIALEAAERERDVLRKRVNVLQFDAKKHGKPPIIVLAEADRFNFTSGSAEIAQTFRDALQRSHFPQLVQTIEQFPTVDTIEVIGHTDSSIVTGRSNLDREVVRFLNGQIAFGQLSAGSNADLGLLRALAVRTEWYAWLQGSGTRLPRAISVRCYSAANSAPVDPEKLGVGRDDLSRRIEIRFTQLKQ